MPSDKKIEGILMPMPVAFKADGAIDAAATDAIIDFYLAAGVHGFFPLGTHGQGMVMEIDERKKVAEQIVNRVRGRVPVVMHISASCRPIIIPMMTTRCTPTTKLLPERFRACRCSFTTIRKRLM